MVKGEKWNGKKIGIDEKYPAELRRQDAGLRRNLVRSSGL
jgi:hypothetical protein